MGVLRTEAETMLLEMLNMLPEMPKMLLQMLNMLPEMLSIASKHASKNASIWR